MIATLRRLPGITVPEVPENASSSWYALALTYHSDELDELPIDAVVAALQAEGCLELDQPGSTRPLNEHPLFQDSSARFPLLAKDWPRYRSGQFPNAERLRRRDRSHRRRHHRLPRCVRLHLRQRQTLPPAHLVGDRDHRE
jgi:dTDP-4-amino-4,6-dideoxygalactose transaminase